APANWSATTSALQGNATVGPLLVRLGTVFGDVAALDALKKLVLDPSAEMTARRTALTALIEARPADLRAICQSLLTTPALSPVAMRGLSLFDDPAIAIDLAKRYP